MRVCKVHGLTEYALEGRGKYRCRACRTKSISDRRRQMKLTLAASLGGKCSECGYDKCIDALEFHHRDPAQKDFRISAAVKSKARLLAEVAKCALLCANCHREVHAGLRTLSC